MNHARFKDDKCFEPRQLAVILLEEETVDTAYEWVSGHVDV